MRCRIHAIVLLLLAACATPVAPLESRLPSLLPADVILIGEQHDAPEHQQTHRQVIEALAGRGVLAAVALEMAEQGHTTAGVARDASEAQVKAALAWEEAGWPWAAYGPAVMAAVRAGVPVLGANLPRSQMRAAMADTLLDAGVPADVLQAQREAVKSGHCDLLPDTQVGPMVRIQLARDQTMAKVLAQAVAPGKTVLLLAGGRHVDELLGVPRYLPAGVRARSEHLPEQPPKKDYCEELREQMKARRAS